MIEKDGKEIKGNITEIKPKPMLGQKNERELHPKFKKLFRLLINNVWFSIGLFAFVAIPYFFFLIQNLERKEREFYKQKLKGGVNLKNDTILNPNFKSEPIVLNEVKKFNIQEGTNVFETKKNNQLVTPPIDSINGMLDSVNPSLGEFIVSDTLLISAQINFTDDEKLNLTKVDKSKKPIVFYRDRIVLQEKINHVSFYLIENINDRLVFERNGHKIFLTNKEGEIKVSTNSDKIKTELLNLVYFNRNKIFEYYSK